MNKTDRDILMEFKNRIPVGLKSHLVQLIIFGSRARDNAPEDSDLDAIALVDQKTVQVEKQLEDIAYQVMWDHNFTPIISLKVFPESRFRDAVSRGISFYKRVSKEGVAI